MTLNAKEMTKSGLLNVFILVLGFAMLYPILWLNPGEILGWKGPPTCAVYDTASGGAQTVLLE